METTGASIEELKKHATELGIRDGDIKPYENGDRVGIEVSFKCGCMPERRSLKQVVNKRKFPVTMQEAQAKLAEDILEEHRDCMDIEDPRLKRNWFDNAKLDQEHEANKKAKTDAVAMEADRVALHDHEQNRQNVDAGAAVNIDPENGGTFDDPALLLSPPFKTDKSIKQLNPWDNTPAAPGGSTHRTRLWRALSHPLNGLKRLVRFWAFGSIVRYSPHSWFLRIVR